jgi:uncharacterized membrane protein YfcA
MSLGLLGAVVGATTGYFSTSEISMTLHLSLLALFIALACYSGNRAEEPEDRQAR